MTTILISLVIAFSASLCAIKAIKPISYKIGLVDVPNHRKKHNGEIPLIGGIAVFVGVLTACSILYPHSQVLDLYLISSALIVFVGALDDYRELAVSVRLCAQVLISSIMVFGANLHIESFGNILGFGSVELLWFGYPITVLAVIAAINAFNMTDGIDGLAGSLSVVSFLSLACLMLLSNAQYSYVPLILAFATIPYLAFNLGLIGGQAKKIFMGDAGSMFVGLSVVWLLVLGSQGESPAFRPVSALWIIAIPLWDMCAITLRRISQGRSPFMPDREHLHHIFLRMGYSSKKSLVLIVCLAVIFAMVGVLGELYQIPEIVMFVGFLLLFAGYYFSLKHVWKLTKIAKVVG
ncbi:undecaprenyl-phosphate alpha-N-acetylglucosaminyl 1-phosphate transferase [Alteromonadaceae bacterium M269]|nr:undecaprenyl-phosphate alpha-N-acetylglucosaminyl 1-phosphate transferase [Alteromonadaceae bacterium M269]